MKKNSKSRRVGVVPIDPGVRLGSAKGPVVATLASLGVAMLALSKNRRKLVYGSVAGDGDRYLDEVVLSAIRDTARVRVAVLALEEALRDYYDRGREYLAAKRRKKEEGCSTTRSP